MVEVTTTLAKESVGRSRRWTGWAVELAVIFVVILTADVALRPSMALLEVTPHIFWIPVLAMALLYGTVAGIIAAGAAAAIAWWHGWPALPADADYYSTLLEAGKEPVLWLLGALAIGSVRDRDTAVHGELRERSETAEKQRAIIAEHATSLRRHIEVLEHKLALASEPLRISEQLEAIARCEADELESRVHEACEVLLGSRSVALWIVAESEWQRAWGTEELGVVAAPFAARLAARGHPVGLPSKAIGSTGSTAAEIAAPVVDLQTGRTAGILLFSFPERLASEYLAVGFTSCLATILGARLQQLFPGVAAGRAVRASLTLLEGGQ